MSHQRDNITVGSGVDSSDSSFEDFLNFREYRESEMEMKYRDIFDIIAEENALMESSTAETRQALKKNQLAIIDWLRVDFNDSIMKVSECSVRQSFLVKKNFSEGKSMTIAETYKPIIELYIERIDLLTKYEVEKTLKNMIDLKLFSPLGDSYMNYNFLKSNYGSLWFRGVCGDAVIAMIYSNKKFSPYVCHLSNMRKEKFSLSAYDYYNGKLFRKILIRRSMLIDHVRDV